MSYSPKNVDNGTVVGAESETCKWSAKDSCSGVNTSHTHINAKSF